MRDTIQDLWESEVLASMHANRVAYLSFMDAV